MDIPMADTAKGVRFSSTSLPVGFAAAYDELADL
jgi:hypothetical protein